MQIRLINGTVNGISAADFPQLLLIANQDIGLISDCFYYLSGKVAAIGTSSWRILQN